MPDTVTQGLTRLCDLGLPAELWELARRPAPSALAPAPGPGRRDVAATNAHIHLPPNFSAFQSVEQAVDLAAGEKLAALGVSNYYDYRVYGPFIELAQRRGIFPLFGLEIICMLEDLRAAGTKINDPGNPGKMYICGKGITRFAESNMPPEGRRLLSVIRGNDRARMAAMVERLERVFVERGLPTGLDEKAVIDMVVRRHGCERDTVYLQERHLCQAFQEAVFASVAAGECTSRLTAILGTAPKIKGPDDHVGVQNEIRTHLMKTGKPAFIDETFISFDDAYRLILELGGIPCYPTLADGAAPICPFEDPPEELIARIKARNIHAVEFIPIRNQPAVLERYVKAMRAAGLVVTAGTEHNTLDLIPMAPTCVKSQAIPPEVAAIFWEGACVVAAHQFLTLRHEAGFVDSAGKPNPCYPDPQRGPHHRIADFARLGAAVMRRYRDQSARSN